MNNSHITPKVQHDLTIEKTQQRETQLVRIIEAIREIRGSGAWSTLKTEVFEGLTTNLERDLRDEAKKDNPNTNKLNRLAGEIKWAERFSDLDKFESAQMVELQMVRLRLHGKEN